MAAGDALSAEALSRPIFAPFAPLLARLPPGRLPTNEELDALAAGVTTADGKPLRFVAPRLPGDGDRRSYEERIADTGEVETRPGNRHDFFNALAWLAYPRAKGAINQAHAALLAERGEAEARRRGPERDALTLFDEGGVAVASSDPALFGLIVDFEWKALFWTRRAELERHMRFFAFGHALLEKALDPYLGIVAKTVFLEVDPGFAALDRAAQVERIDLRLAAHFAERANFPTPKRMAPMPVLGIPGWHPQTEQEAFYDDRRHFRRKVPSNMAL